MEREEFQQIINKELIRIELIISIWGDYPIKEVIKDSDVELAQKAHDYLSNIKTDLDSNIIPKNFYLRIYHNIQYDENSKMNWAEDDLNANCIYYIDNEVSYFKNIMQHIPTYDFYKSLGFISTNTVFVGANGSGKSSLTSMLKTSIDERDGIVIPAQKLLIIPTFSSIPNLESTSSEYDSYQRSIDNYKHTYNASKDDDIPYSETKKLSSEYKFVLKKLIAEKVDSNEKFCKQSKEDGSANRELLHTNLDKALEIWNSLIEHRIIFYEKGNIMVKTLSDIIYEAYNLSDGEKLSLFLIGRILLAPPSALIVVDEPEMFLHKAIVNKLWDKLESERADCLFVYLTHDLEFATTRDANKYWIKEFTHPQSWQIEAIPDNEIPQELLMKLLGSRKKILFCEGTRENSLDTPIFECLFPQYTIIPVQSCNDVINYTRAYNNIPNKNSVAYGIIDRDFRVDEQLTKLETEGIYSYDVAEIENLFLVEDFITEYSKFKQEEIDIIRVKQRAIECLKKDEVTQISNYVSAYINYNFTQTHVKKGNNKVDVTTNYNLFTDNIKIDEWYAERSKLIEKIIDENNYSETIKLYNNKGLHIIVENALGLKPSHYRDKAFNFLKNSVKGQDILRAQFPRQLQE